MVKLLQLAKEKNARLILGGDTRQHASVVRGDALRILNTVGGISAAELNAIQRQKSAAYRDIVQDLANGNIANGFFKLNGLGAITNAASGELVKDYLAALKNRKSALVISPTHKEGDAVTEEIRAALRQKKKIGKKEVFVSRFVNLNMTEAERSDARNYEAGQVIQFTQNVKLAKRGSRWVVKKIKDDKITIENLETGNQIPLPKGKADRFAVFEKSSIGLSKGDKIRITQNGFDAEKKRLDNGTVLEVVSVKKNGATTLRNKASKSIYKLQQEFGHIAHAHCITSHAAQGKTVDHVFIAQPAATFGATNAKQFYVSVSRGRESIAIYTDDKEELLLRTQELGDRQSALELVKQKDAHHEHVVMQQRVMKEQSPPPPAPIKTPQQYSKNQSLDLDYER